jgi:hypothetical protein
MQEYPRIISCMGAGLLDKVPVPRAIPLEQCPLSARRLRSDGMRFEHPVTEEQVFIRPASYVWAGLLGAAYVYRVGRDGVGRAALINLASAVVLIGFFQMSLFLPPTRQLLALAFFVPLLVLLQGRWMISIVRRGYARAGWKIYRA